VPHLKELIRIVGEGPHEAASDITMRGIEFRDAAATYLDDWGIPSGGDWALHRGGAFFIENATNINIDHTHFTLLDGNAVFLSGYTRPNATL